MKKTKEKERTTFDVEVDWAKPLLEAAAGRRNLPSPPEGRAQEEREGVVEGRAHEGVVAGEGHCRVFLDAGGDGRKKREDYKKGQKMCVSVCFRMKKGKKKLFSHFLLPPTTACFSLSKKNLQLARPPCLPSPPSPSPRAPLAQVRIPLERYLVVSRKKARRRARVDVSDFFASLSRSRRRKTQKPLTSAAVAEEEAFRIAQRSSTRSAHTNSLRSRNRAGELDARAPEAREATFGEFFRPTATATATTLYSLLLADCRRNFF